MKTKFLLTLLSVSALSAANVYAADGQINFTGTITDEACTVTNNTTNPLNVALGTVSKNAFTGAGSTAAPTKFTIALTDCPATVTSATVKFDGTSANSGNTALQLTQESGVATNVGVQISDSSNVVIPLYTASKAYALSTGANNLDFIARYFALADTDSITSGPANSTSQFTIVYN